MPARSPHEAGVLIVDDSAVARQAVSRAIARSSGIRVAGLANDGQVGLERVEELAPDIVVLDLDMPRMDGLTFLRRLRPVHPDLPVVVFSSMTRDGAAATLEAMNAGATAYVLKPSALRGEGAGDAQTDLIPVVQAILRRPGMVAHRTTPRTPIRGVRAVVIAVSTGGPTALQAVLPHLPADLPVPVLVVQHMPATFTGLLAERLDRGCPLRVVEASEGQPVAAGTVYIAPGGRHLTVTGTETAPKVTLTDDPPVNSCRPAADVLFETAARVFRGSVLAVVMTGMGSDGLRGARRIVAAGGMVLAQDPHSAVVGSMPAAVIEAGLTYDVKGLDQLAEEIVRCLRGVEKP